MGLKRLAGNIFNYGIYAVDGERIRNEIEIDFVAGGNHGRYPEFIPEQEIWIETAFSPLDFVATALHEFIEVTLMRRTGMDYDPAHDYANTAESQFRQEFEGQTMVSLPTAEQWLEMFLGVDPL